MPVNISPKWPAGDSGQGSGLPIVASGPRLREVTPAPTPENVTVRPARLSDMRTLEPLIGHFASDNLMLPKNIDQLTRAFREFDVAVDENDRILGCGALRVYNEGLAEVISLAIDEPYQGMGIGRMLVERLVEDGRGLGLQTVFALTLKPDFFERLGWRIVTKDRFPLKVWADCRNCPKLHACDEVAVAIEL
jgi:N-acetylglutamate synthase-like GNAT family acetyltransferase